MTSIVYLCRIDSEHGRKSERKHSGVTLGLNFFVIGNDSLLAHRQTALGPQLTSCNESLPVLGFSEVSVVNRAFSEEQDLTFSRLIVRASLSPTCFRLTDKLFFCLTRSTDRLRSLQSG